MEFNRAYAVLEVKGMDDDERVIEGMATTPTTDRMGDVVEPMGAKFALPMPLLLHHDSRMPVGEVTFAKPTKAGIPFKAKVAKITEPGVLKDRCDEAWQSVKAKLIRGVSIGFRSLEHSFIEGGGIKFAAWEWMELSLVALPANSEATISTIKSADEAARRAASGAQASGSGGRPVAGQSGSPGASGTKKAAHGGPQLSRKANTMKTLQELRELRATKNARLKELVDLFQTEGHETTDDESAEFDTLETEIKGLDTDIRVAQYNAINAAAATPVNGKSSAQASASRGGLSFVRKQDPDDKFKGQAFTRMAIAKAIAYSAMKDGNFVTPAQVAEQRWGKTHPNLVQWIKAGVAGGGTGSGEWGAELADSNTRFTGDFIEYLYSMTVFDRLPLREVPARVHIKGQDGASTGYWVGESKGVPVTTADFSDVELTPLKVGAIAVCSKELVADSSPSAEMWIRDSLAQASAQRVDTTFLGSGAASSGVSPAGLLNGLSALSPSGTDAAAVRADLMALYVDFLSAKNASGLVHVMTPSMAKALSLLVNTLGQAEFPGITATGGTLLGDTVYTGDNVTAGNWILLKPSDIWKIGDSGLEISMSDTATIEQDSAPQGAGDTPTAASATLMSLWQSEQVGFKVVRRINYQKRRSGAVKYLADAEYGGVVS